MPTDEDFLRKLLDNPTDDTARLVYADWLDEQGDETSLAKAKFLRLTANLTGPARTSERRQALQKLAAGLDTDWLAVVSKLDVENCAGKKKAPPPTTGGMRIGFLSFEVLCDKRWNELAPTENREVRFCDGCQEQVHYCDTIVVARRHARAGHCVAVDLGVIRRDQDLGPQLMLVGRPSAESQRRERERQQPDPVSAERERRKRESGADRSGE